MMFFNKQALGQWLYQLSGVLVLSVTMFGIASGCGLSVETDGPLKTMASQDKAWVLMLEPQLEADALKLEAKVESAWVSIGARLGAQLPLKNMTLRVVRNAERMKLFGPADSPAPSHASGVTYPMRGLILIALINPVGGGLVDFDKVLTHELVHLYLHRLISLTEPHFLPAWFSEGMATSLAGEYGFERIERLFEQTAFGNVPSLISLNQAFARHDRGVEMAYTFSADFVTSLLSQQDSKFKVQRLLTLIESGEEFEYSFVQAFGVSLVAQEKQWKQGLWQRHVGLPLMAFAGSFWIVIALVFLVLARRRKKYDVSLIEMRWEQEQAWHEPTEYDRIEDQEWVQEKLLVQSNPPGQVMREPNLVKSHLTKSCCAESL